MKRLKPFIGKYIAAPLRQLRLKVFNKGRIEENCKSLSNIIFKYSKETALIMILGNAVGILSSHLAQINGLKKSKRENKDYLIQQEKIEIIPDIVLSTLPPLFIKRAVQKKVEGGHFITKELDYLLRYVVGPEVGCHRADFYSTKHIRPVKETVISTVTKIIDFTLKKYDKFKPKTKENLKNYSNKLKAKLPDFAMPASTLGITTKFDDLQATKTITNLLKNGKATDEIHGYMEGMQIAAVIGYTIVASNIIMPIIKHKISKAIIKKDMKKKGITPETIARKKRYAYNSMPAEYNTSKVFIDSDFSTLYNNKNIFTERPKTIEKQKDKSNVFSSFNDYTQIASKSSGLKI